MMNTNYSRNMLFRKSALIFIIALIIPYAVMANGNMDSDKDYEGKLKETTARICSSLEAKTMTAAQAKSELSELRLRYRKEYTDESGKMDSVIDDLGNGVITAEQARDRFNELEELRLQERKREELHMEEQKKEELKIQEKQQNKTNNPDSDSKPDPNPSPDPKPNSSPNANKNEGGTGGK
jgi:TolA-binding protein